MRVDHRLRAAPSAIGRGGEPEVDLAGERDLLRDATDLSGPQVKYRHHADCIWRCPKSDAQLLADGEFIALAERRRR